MHAKPKFALEQPDIQELSEWIEAFDQIVAEEGVSQGARVLEALTRRAQESGVDLPVQLNTPYVNTIPADEEVAYPGDRALERRIKSLIRWNAMAMVHRQNKKDPGIGGHISTFSSVATLFEVGFNHFFHASYGDQPGDFVYFQGHASPGVYSRAFLEGRISQEQVGNFRHELRDKPGLSSYPHPWLMKDFWSFPTVSMGLGPINAIYQARFMKYLEHRGLIPETGRKVWAFLGDGETDEPEALGSITLAAREKLDNLIFVVNCNLQRLDGPVRGNGKIIQELEAAFKGAGWNVIKVIWGSNWDPLLRRDITGMLAKRMEECVDGEYQAFKAKDGAFVRKEFFGKYPETAKLVENMSDDEIWHLQRGGLDPQKVYNAYKRALEHKGGPTVILAKTIKGYGLGSAQARNATHQEKKMTDEALTAFRSRFEIPIPDKAAKEGALYRPPEDSPEIRYMQQMRKALGGFMPARSVPEGKLLDAPPLELFKESLEGSRGRAVSTTMGFVSMLRVLLKDKTLGKLVVPIVPDEARTFGMESIFRQVGIYASQGQLYKPHDVDMLLYYREERNGQILEEGITEPGSMASMTAAGTAYSNYRVPTIPFYIYYSMFGYQRVGDLVWAFADARGKGFMMGGTAGRTTLLGEGLQHQDGHSPLLFSAVPTCAIYDPAYVYEIAVIVQDGLRRMYQEKEDRFYYITLYNQDYAMPEMPKGAEEGILRGIYRYKPAEGNKAVVQLFGSGPILNEAVAAQSLLAEKFNVAADVWSVTSYNELRRDALAVERWNRLHPAEKARQPYIVKTLGEAGAEGPIIAASDYMKAVPDQLAPWIGTRMVSLGTDGFGRSDNREHLRQHFEINAESIAAAALSRLARDGKFDVKKTQKAFEELSVNPEKVDPAWA
ncbi:MAG TPA: pyruvate dehydrogenase (acetyl-transferring), homodimeric type [Candidatus Acidoferrales bacterium]|nr:pyruvate dehydrogenase (acetyl-transferring), homodimeric type [Candidatus Acidoferrales bacterium]